MNARALAASRLATAVRVALPARRMAFQFFRAMLAVPRMPQRQTDGMGGNSEGSVLVPRAGTVAGLHGTSSGGARPELTIPTPAPLRTPGGHRLGYNETITDPPRGGDD